MTTPPPSECPTNVACSISSASRRSRNQVAKAPIEWSPCNRVDSPCPARSGAMTSYSVARRSTTVAHSELSPAMPCTSTTHGRVPSPWPARRKEARRPWTEIVERSLTPPILPVGRLTDALGHPPDACRRGEQAQHGEDPELEPLERPVPAGGLIGDQDVERLGRLCLTGLERLLNARRCGAGMAERAAPERRRS